MNQKATNILKLIGKGVAVIVTPGSLIALAVIAVLYFYYRYKKKKEAETIITPEINSTDLEKTKTGSQSNNTL